MIVITHDLAVLYQIADTILVMYAGKLAEKAPAETIVDAPRHPYTRLLISSLPEVGVRFDETRLDRDPRQAAVAARPAGRLPVPRPLPARVREVRGGAAVRRGRAGPRGRVLEGGGLMLALDGVSKVYKVGTFGAKRLRAVNDVSFEVAPGEVVSLIGESGSGKTHDRPDDPRGSRGRRRGRSRSTGTTSRDSTARALKRVLRRRAGRLPGSVQLVQPDLQGRPGASTLVKRVLPRDRPRRVGREGRAVARRRAARARRRASASTRTS